MWKPGNMVYPLPVVMVTVSDGIRDNIITVAWTGTVCTNPSLAYISVRPERYSYEILKNSNEFVINLTTEKLVYATDFCGVRSGREIDKFEKLGLNKEMGQFTKAPLIKESPINIECKVKDIIAYGSHDMFIAEVLAVHADKNYMDEKNKFHLNNANPIVYSHGEYYSLGNKLGTFGFSVKKQQKRKKTKKAFN